MHVVDAMPRRGCAALAGALALGAFVAGTLGRAAVAVAAEAPQPPYPQGWARVQGNRLTFCISAQQPLFEVEESIARALALVMGANPDIFVYHASTREGPAMPIQRREYTILLTDYCDVFMGLPRSINATFDYPADEQQLSTRPYYATQFVLASRRPGRSRLSDWPAGQPLGVEAASLPSLFLSVLRPSLTQKHYPRMVGSAALLDALERGEIDAAVVWAPALYHRWRNPESAGVSVQPIGELPNMEWLIVGGIRRDRTGLRTQIDAAILRLLETGRIQAILKEHHLPPAFFRPAPVRYVPVEGDTDDDD